MMEETKIKIKINNSALELTMGDITQQDTDAVVNAANKRLAPGGGVAGAIHRAAGPRLWEECKKMGGCETGAAKITKGYNLPAEYVIHTVGPIYSGSPMDEKKLESCYRESIKLAVKHDIKTISFPSISTGYFRYPVEKAAETAIKIMIDTLRKTPQIKLVRFVLYDEKTLDVYKKTLKRFLTEEKN